MNAVATARKRGPIRRALSTLLLIALILLALLVGAAFLVQSRIDPAALRQRIERQCYEATGRTLALDDVRLVLLPVPTLTATGVSLSGLPGDSRPQMLTASRLSAHLALWPLLYHVARLDGVTLTDPDLSLERHADGQANWRFTPPPKPHGPGSTPGGGARWQVEINSVRLRDGSVAWRDAVGGWSGAVSLDRLDASDLAGAHPQADLAGRHDVAGFTAEIGTGSLHRLLDAGADGPAAWPLHLVAQTGRNGREDARLSVEGTMTDPARGRGFALDLRFDAQRPDGIDALFPHAGIPALGPVSGSARVIDVAPAGAPAASPALERVSLRAEKVDLGALIRRRWSQGLVLDRLAVDAAGRDAPVQLAADGSWQGRSVSVRGAAGTLRGWRFAEAQDKPSPFDLTLRAGDARATLTGQGTVDSLDAAVKLEAPSLRALLPVGPALTALTLSAHVTVGPDRHVSVQGLDLQSRELALAGDADLSPARRPVLNARLSSAHVDWDALRAGWIDPAPAPSAEPNPAAQPIQAEPGTPAEPTAPPTRGGDAPAAAPVPAAEHAVPFARLDCCDAAVQLDAAAVTFDRGVYRNVSTALTLHDGVLDLARFSASGPAGPVALSGQANARTQSLSVQLHPLSLPATTLAAWLGRAPVLDGGVEIVADLKATGPSWETMARDAEGHAGLSMVDGAIATEALGQLIGRPQAAQAGTDPDGARTPFRCLALPAQIAGGMATLDPIALSTSRLVVQGRGTVSLTDGRLDLHLMPRLAVGATGASLPVRIGGTLDAPEAALDPAATGGRFSLTIGGSAPPDPCGADLAAARYGVAGPVPSAAPPAGKRKLPKPIDILRGLGLFH
ncbi:AsmA family protein [Acetobacteraceae bacterium KSS8]|uniref:AsmA family protein n=1 Tax=Endosaccharibacter trunci TaxID=2812733 RepID=A0ABT1W8E7_9PROT|nr:AsmA family protein [Acetobacteraceae bacterium KSS8]